MVEEGALTRGAVTDRAAAALGFVFATRGKLLLPSREGKKKKKGGEPDGSESVRRQQVWEVHAKESVQSAAQ